MRQDNYKNSRPEPSTRKGSGHETSWTNRGLTEMPRNRAVLVVTTNTESASELVAFLGMAPDRQWERGDLRGKQERHGRHDVAGAEYESKCDRGMSPDSHVLELGQRLESLLQRLTDVSRDDARQIERRCWVYHEANEMMTGFDLSPESLAPFASARCTVGINVDFVGSDAT